jgi:hypothetical protein
MSRSQEIATVDGLAALHFEACAMPPEALRFDAQRRYVMLAGSSVAAWTTHGVPQALRRSVLRPRLGAPAEVGLGVRPPPIPGQPADR